MSVSGLTNQYTPATLDGLNVVEADQIYIDGKLIDLDNLVPYTGATQALNMGSFPVQSSHVPSAGNDLVNYTTLVASLTNQDVTNDVTYLNKITSTAQTVQASTTFLTGLSVSNERTTNLSSKVVVDANYQNLITSADVSVSQNFGSISSVPPVYQATTDTASGTPILIGFPIVSGKRYRFTIEMLVEDPTYGWYVEFLQSADNINPVTGGIIGVYLIPTGSTAYTASDHTFVALTTGSVIIQTTTDGPSGNDQAVKWKNLTVYEMGVSLENASYPSLGADRVPILNDKRQLVASGINSTQLGYLDNVSSDIQSQLNARVLKAGDTMTGALNMGANKITTTYTPVNPEDVITKGYGDSAYATTSALSGYLPLTGGTLTGNFTVNGGTTTSLSGGMTIATNTRATTANLSGSTIGGTVSSATITTLPSPPPIYNGTYSGSFYGGLLISFTPVIGRTYQYTFTKFYRQGLPSGIFTFEFLQDVGSLALPLAPATTVVPTSYATALTYTGTIRPTTTGNVYLRFYSISVGATNFFWDSFTLTDITASLTAPLDLTQSITQSTIHTTAEFAGGGLQVIQRDVGFTAAGFLTTSLPTGVQGGTITGPTSNYYRLTSLASQAEMGMRLNNFTPIVGERYTYTFRGIRSSVPLTLQIVQATSLGVISTQPTTNNITVAEQSISGSFIIANNTLTFAFRFQAGSANPWVEWASFQLTRADTNTAGTLTSPNVYIGDGALPAANSAGTTTLFNTGNICTNRNRLIFSNGSTDWNHCIYNNYRNLDNEGIFDGMKMNVYLGLQVRVGNAAGVVPTTALSIDSAGRMGIGITNPGSVLDVVSTTAQYNTSLRVRTDWAGIQLASSGSGGRTYNLLSSITGAGIGAGGFGIFDETSGAYRLYVVSNGFVGIGAAANGTFVGANCKLTVNADYNVGDTGGFCINATDGPNANFYNLRIFPYVQGGGLVAYQFRTYNQAIAYDSFKIAAGGDVFFDKKVNIGVASDGMINIRNPNGSVTHFGWTDNWNYIRGVATQIDTSYVYANSIFNIYSGTRYAVLQGFMAQGSLTLGGIDRNYGGGSGWNANTAALMLECLTATEIAVHDAGQRVASLMYFVGDAANTITIGRDMGWGTTQVLVPSSLSCGGYFQVGTGNAWMKMGVKGGTISGDIYTTANWPQNHNAMLISQDANQGPNTSGMCLGYGTLNSQTGVITCLGPSVAWRNLYISAGDTYVLRNGVTVAYTQAGGWVNISDEREKEDIQDIKTSSSLKRVLALKPKHYRRKYYETGTPVPEETKHQRIIGFCAQEVKESNPHCVSEWDNEQVKCEEDDGKRYGICYNDYVVHLVGAVQEVVKQLEVQKERVQVLEEREKVWVQHAKEQEATIKEQQEKVKKLEANIEKLAGLVSQLISKQ